MEISGKIIEVLPLKSGTSPKGEWQSQQYVLETIGGGELETVDGTTLTHSFLGRRQID